MGARLLLTGRRSFLKKEMQDMNSEREGGTSLHPVITFRGSPHWKTSSPCMKQASGRGGAETPARVVALGRRVNNLASLFVGIPCEFHPCMLISLGRSLMATVLEPPVIIQQAVPSRQTVVRNVAVDAYRGLVMLLMMAEVLQFWRVSQAFPTSLFWKILALNQTHVEWSGCSLHDTIQPGVLIPGRRGSCRIPSPAASPKAERSGSCSRTPCGGRWCWWRSASSCAPWIIPRPTSPSKTRSRRSASDTRSCSCSGFVRRSGRGRRWASSWWATGWPGRSIPWRPPASIGSPSALPRHGMATQLHRIRRALEQELQSRQRLRPVVPEPFPARAAVCLQQRRVPDAQLHSHARAR